MNLYLVDNKNSTKWHAKAKRNQRNDQERLLKNVDEKLKENDWNDWRMMDTTAKKESKKQLKVSLKDGTIEASSHNIESANVGWRSTGYQFISRIWSSLRRLWNSEDVDDEDSEDEDEDSSSSSESSESSED